MRRLLGMLMRRDPRECEETRALMSDYVDGDLAPQERARVDAHVGGCRRCRRVLANLRHTLGRLHILGASPPPGGEDPARVAESVRRAWREQA